MIDLETLPSVPLAERKMLPEVSAIYLVIDSIGQVQYIGRSVNLKTRWNTHHRLGNLSVLEGIRICWVETEPQMLDEVEAALIEWFQPSLNGWRKPTQPRERRRMINTIAEYAQKRGITVQALAIEIGVQPSTIYRLRANPQSLPDNRTLDKIFKAYADVKLDDLIKYVPSDELK